MAGFAHKPPTPETFYRAFFQDQAPSDQTLVWLIATPRPYFTYVDYRPLKVSNVGEPPVTTENAYAALLGIAYVAFYVVGWSGNEPNLDGLERFDESMLPLWPSQKRTITFPPNGPPLDWQALDLLADAPFGKADRSAGGHA